MVGVYGRVGGGWVCVFGVSVVPQRLAASATPSQRGRHSEWRFGVHQERSCVQIRRSRLAAGRHSEWRRDRPRRRCELKPEFTNDAQNGGVAREATRDAHPESFGDWEAFDALLRATPPGNEGRLALRLAMDEITPKASERASVARVAVRSCAGGLARSPAVVVCLFV